MSGSWDKRTRRCGVGGWDPHELERMKNNCDKYGVVLEAIRMKSEYVNKLRKGPEREREIDIIVGNIRKGRADWRENHYLSL